MLFGHIQSRHFTTARKAGIMQTMTSEAIQVGPVTIRFRVEAEESAGSVTMFEFDVPAGIALPAAHSHDGYEETVYGLEGVLTWTIEGRQVAVGPGDVLVIPRGAVHNFANHGETDGRSLAVVTPGILGPAYFRETAEILNAAAAAGTPPDFVALGEVMARHGLTCAA
jgi:quercetin dioxygenase-like cupin family protein